MDDKKPGDRRHFLRCGLSGTLTTVAALTALSARGARAQEGFPKATREQAGYQDQATSQTCANCTLFIPPDDCKVVQGPVSETGTCNYFTQ